MSENLTTKEVPGGIEQYQRALEYERAERQRTVDQWLEERREKDARIADLTAEVAELRRALTDAKAFVAAAYSAEGRQFSESITYTRICKALGDSRDA
ncbi:MAG: hypothetical protein ABL964_09875 [Steroidobacteraceae bacterium]